MKKDDAFVTVEYALLLPVLFFVYAFLIYIGFYQYNECLKQQDMYLYAVEGEEEVPKNSPQNILRICKRLNDEQ